MAPERVRALYFDTSSLRRLGWPDPGAALAEVLKLAKAAGVPVVIPEFVLIELDELHQRELKEEMEALGKSLDSLRGRLGSVAAPTLPTEQEFRDEYHKRVTHSLGSHEIQIAPLNDRPVRDVLMEAAAHRPPFRNQDAGFRDSMIALSVVEHRRALDGGTAVILVHDKGFAVNASFLRQGAVTPMSDLADVKAMLTALLTDKFLEGYNARQAELKTELLRHTGLHPHLEANLLVPKRLDGLYGTVLEVDGIEVRGVRAAGAGFGQDAIGRQVEDGFAELEIRLHLLVQPWSPPRQTMLGVGSRQILSPEAEPFEGDAAERVLDTIVTLHFQVHRSDRGELQFSLGDVALGDLDQRLVQQLVQQQLQKRPS